MTDLLGKAASTEPHPGRLQSARTSDVDEQAALLRGWNQTYNQISAGSFEGAFMEANLGSVHIFREVTSNFLHQTGALPKGTFAIGIPVKLEGSATFCGAPCDGRQLHVFSGDDGFEFYSPSGLDIAGVVLSHESLETALELAGYPSEFSLEHAYLRAVSPERGNVLRTILLRAAEALGHESWPDDDADLVASLSRDIVSAVADAIADDATQEGQRIPQAKRWQIVQRACAFAHEVPEDLITIEAICAHLGISRRALQYCFQDTLNVPPAAYLRAVRLNGARRAIKACGSVTDAATQWGFWHFGRFAQDYKALFGELPSETARQYHRHERSKPVHARQ